MDIKYVVSVKRFIDTAAPGEEPKVEEKVLADFTGGPNEASALLASLAEGIQKSKKPLGWAMALKALTGQLEKENAKKRAAGEPTLAEEFRNLMKDDETAR
jgi:hypothetical protein